MGLLTKIVSPFVKTAASFQLGDDPASWSNEILSQLYKQHAYLGKYQVDLTIEGQDQPRGYLYGSFQVRNPSAVATAPVAGPQSFTPSEESVSPSDPSAPMATPGVGQRAAAPATAPAAPGKPGAQQSPVVSPKQPASGEQVAKIPVIVTERKLAGFDVFIDPAGKFHPLDEQTFSELMFSGDTFSTAPMSQMSNAADGGFDPSLASESSEIGGSYGGPDGYKTASARIVETVVRTVGIEERQAFAASVTADPWLNKVAASPASSLPGSLSKLVDRHRPAKKRKMTKCSAAVVEKTAGGYTITAVDADSFDPSELFVANAQAAKMLTPQVKEAIANDGMCLIVDDPCVKSKTASASPETVTKFGVYELMEKTGSQERGIVFPSMLRLDGTTSGISLALSLHGAAIQESVSGVPVDMPVSLAKTASDKFQGNGVLVLGDSDISEPINVHTTVEDKSSGSTLFKVSDSFGRRYDLVKSAYVSKMTQAKDGVVVIPATTMFLSLPTAEVEFAKTAAEYTARLRTNSFISDNEGSVTLVKADTGYSFQGLDDIDSTYVKTASALLLLGAMGYGHGDAISKLAAADKGKRVALAPKRKIVAPKKSKCAARRVDVSAVRVNLVKEAAELNLAPNTMDAILSLNFVTPENVQGFVDALPEYEEALSGLAELLIAVRLGLPDIKESAVSSAMKGLTKVVAGLKGLAITLQSE